MDSLILVQLIISMLFALIFIRYRREVDKKGGIKNIVYHFYGYSLEFLIPYIIIVAAYYAAAILITHIAVSETINLQKLIDIEKLIAKSKVFYSQNLKPNAVQVWLIFLLVYLLGILRLPAKNAKGFLRAFSKYRTIIRWCYITLVFLSSYTLLGTQLGAPTKDLRLRIKTIRDGYADVHREVREALAKEVTYELLSKVANAFPAAYLDALSLPQKIENQINSLRNDYESAQHTYGKENIDLPEVQSALTPNSPGKIHIESPPRQANRLLKVNVSKYASTASREIDGASRQVVSFRRLEEAKTAVREYQGRLPAGLISLLKIEGAKNLFSQTSNIFTEGIKTALFQSLIETRPDIEPVIDAFKNTIDKILELNIEIVVDRVTGAIIRDPSGVENTIKLNSSEIVDQDAVKIPEETLEKSRQVSNQLQNELVKIEKAKQVLVDQIKMTDSWNHADAQGTVEAYETFLGAYPKTRYASYAQKALDKIWTDISAKNNIQEYDNFIEEHPKSSLSRKAVTEIRKLFVIMTPQEPNINLNSDLSVDINWPSAPGARSYRIYWTYDEAGEFQKDSSKDAPRTSINHKPDKFPVYYRVVAMRDELESQPSKARMIGLLSDEGGTKCQICGDKAYGRCHMRNIYVCNKHTYFSSGGTAWRCPP